MTPTAPGSPWPGVDDAQYAGIRALLPGAELVNDVSWGVTRTTVLHVRSDGDDRIVKVGSPGDSSILRELDAHERFAAVWSDAGRAPRLVGADAARRVLVTTYLPGVLASDLPADPEHHRQAGGLLRRFHGQATRWAPDWERRRTEQALAQLDAPHALDRDAVLAAATWLTAQRPASTALVPTHGDYRPRNWLVHEGVLRVIDLGRAGWRPASADLLRLSAQEWRGRADLEEAFLDGYGADPRTADAWRLMLVREAIGAAVWGRRADDPVVEAEAGRMLRGLLP